LLPGAQIYSFEPLPASFRRLQERFKGDSKFTAFQTAMGDSTGEIEFYQDEFSVASSALPHSETSKKTFSQVGRTVKIRVPILTLDDWAQDFALEGPVLLKMDVQGYERPVILGGGQLMKRVDALIVEVCFLELYQNQALFCDIHAMLTERGFSLMGIHEEAPHRETGLSIYADAYYERLST
jgi:FkbM family methyltransferase